MSNAVIVERPTTSDEELQWVELGDWSQGDQLVVMSAPEVASGFVELEPLGATVELRGHGADRHGVLRTGDLSPAGPDPTPAPAQDDWDF